MNISMIPNNDVKTIHASQNDTQRKWEFTPFANSKALVSDLPMYIKSLKGNTLVWNQLVQNGNFASTSNWTSPSGTLSASNNIGRCTFTGSAWNNDFRQAINMVAGHKYLVSFDYLLSSASLDVIIFQQVNDSANLTIPNKTTRTHYSAIYTPATSGTDGIRWSMGTNMASHSGQYYELSNVNIFDLTKMGLDVTADQFRALFPLSYYSYDSGSLLSFNGTGIKTVGKNLLELPSSATLNGVTFNVGTDGQIQITGTATAQTDFYLYGTSGRYDDMGIISSTYTFSCRKDSTTTGLNFFLVGQQTGTRIGVELNNTSLSQTVALDGSDKYRAFMRVTNGATINIKVALQLEFGTTATDYEPYTENTTNLPTLAYFPTGMKSAGSVYDELTPSKAITRIGAVDLGTMTWIYDSSVPRFYTTDINSLVNKPANSNTEANAVSIYTNTTFEKLYTSEKKNMTMAIGNTGTLSIINTSYTDDATFKTAMSGVFLCYELATPTEEDVDLNLTYPIEDGGTEELLPVNGTSPSTSPIKMDVVQPSGEESSESFTYKATDASFGNGTYSMVCKNLEIPLTITKGKVTGTSVIGMTNEPGFFDAKLKMTDSDGVCYSTKFQLHVERKP